MIKAKYLNAHRRYMAEILPIQRKTLSNQSILMLNTTEHFTGIRVRKGSLFIECSFSTFSSVRWCDEVDCFLA